MLNNEIGTPNLLLLDFLEYVVGNILLKTCPSNSLTDVFPELPVTAIA